MAAHGKVRFDEPVRESLPRGIVAKPQGFEITLLDLATQHSGLPGMPGAWTLIGTTLLAGLLVTPLTVLAGYYLAVVTYRFGLDPDNQGVPIITSVMDLAGVAVILIVMTSSGVLHG